MATSYISGGTRISGLGYSDMDFDAILDSMYSVECIPRNRFQVWKNDWQTRVDAFQELNSELLAMKRNMDSLATVNKFLSKQATVSKDTVLSASTSADTPEGIYNIDVKQIATTATVTYEGRRFSPGAKINTSGQNGTFSYSYKGQQYDVNVPPDTKIEQFVSLINNDQKNPGVVASLISDGNGNQILQLRGKDLGAKAMLSVTGFSDNLNFGSTQTSKATYTMDQVLNTADPDGKNLAFVFNYDGENYTIDVEPGDTIQKLMEKINALSDETGVEASLEPVDGSTPAAFNLVLKETTSGRHLGITVSANTTVPGMEFTAQASYDEADWKKAEPQNALYSVNGWPEEGLESSSNSLSGAIPGATILLKEAGQSQISISASMDGIKDNIVKFIDSYNTVMAKIQALTKVDSTKDVKETDETNSLYDSQQGSILTGNYGVQMISSKLKNAMSQIGTGFEYATLDADGNLIRGDRYTSLSQIGIKTETDQGSESFGLLTIDEEALNKALSTDLNAVVELFAAGGNGVADSSDFTYDSYVPGTTQNGSFDVHYEVELEYAKLQEINEEDGTPKVDDQGNPVYVKKRKQKVDADGKPVFRDDGITPEYEIDGEGNPVYETDAFGDPVYETTGEPTGRYIITNATINGKPARVNQDDRVITATASGDAAAGLAIMVNNMAPGSYDGTVRMKGGKASDLSSVLSQLNNSDSGTLPVLIKNYKTIMDRIDNKINYENTRLATWYSRKQAEFSRLEATLTSYKGQMSTLESQIKQLSSNSSGSSS